MAKMKKSADNGGPEGEGNEVAKAESSPELKSGDPVELAAELQKIVLAEDTDEVAPVPVADQVGELLGEYDGDTVSAMRAPFKDWATSMQERLRQRADAAYAGIVGAIARTGGRY